MNNKKTIGILAYGSLIEDPDVEIFKATIEVKEGVTTPFNIEFARTSSSRGGAPTLVPVAEGGSPAYGQIIIVDLPEQEAANCLWRRETRNVGSNKKYVSPLKVGSNTVVVERLENFMGIDVVIYTKIASNITPLTVEKLARLAIASVGKTKPRMDGISYLIAAMRNGIVTALSAEYKAEILRQMRTNSLEEALEKLL